MDTRILIVGGGVAGLMTKNRLEALGYAPTLVEKADALRTSGTGILLGANVLRIFRECGLEEALLAKSQKLREIRSLDYLGEPIGGFDLAKIERDTSYATVAIHRHDLHEILSNSVDQDTIKLGYQLTQIKYNGTTYSVSFENGEEGEYDYIIGADGLYSQVREELFGHIGLRDSHQGCWRFVIDIPKDIDITSSCEMWGDKKRVGIFPIGQGKVYCFLVVTCHGEEENMDLDMVLDTFKGFCGDWQSIAHDVASIKPELIYGKLADLDSIILHKDRAILIGDAGHATTPNLGQGAAMGIEGAYLFGELLKEHSIDKAMELYAQKRYNRVNNIRERSRMLGKIAHISSPFLQGVRNFVMRMTPSSIGQKQFENTIIDW
ncbi:MAG: FAD-dependent monooxygenase [Sulfurovaceae bacterium]|nr:FAD-dependent monooxygenase [Sulfurovaceae bacterium]MDD5548785.1 FAD-dependent monooxygenase [Sulfurovaceae bacterium]